MKVLIFYCVLLQIVNLHKVKLLKLKSYLIINITLKEYYNKREQEEPRYLLANVNGNGRKNSNARVNLFPFEFVASANPREVLFDEIVFDLVQSLSFGFRQHQVQEEAGENGAEAEE